MHRWGLIGVALLAGLAAGARAQELPAELPTREELAKDNRLFLTLAGRALRWEQPAEPLRIVGPLHFVGTRGLGAWLFATPEGHILLNTGMPSSGPMIVESIEKLGLDPADIEILINGHAHSDHAGAMAYLKGLTGAELAVMEPDVAPMQDGGKSDFHYGWDWQVMGFPPVEVDRVLRDGDTVRLGDVILTALATPGHTRGATTWTTTLTEGDRAYLVVLIDGGGINPGYRIAGAASYPGIEADYRRTHHRHEMLRPDIWLGHHTEYFGLDRKRARAAAEGVAAWVDPEGYRRFVAAQKRAFEDEMNRALGAAEGPAP